MSNSPLSERSGYGAMKRLFDVLVAFSLLVLVAPVLLMVAITIKLDSPGPIFLRQIRIGQHGEPFRYLKFRTMMIDASETGTGPIFSLGLDPRISAVGRFLRKTALDEVPAILNVLRGDMSFVGPRAALPLEADHYSEMERRRLELKPGITGYWQAFGRHAGANDFQRMVEMDLEYADKQSISLDLKILLRTFVLACKKQAAY